MNVLEATPPRFTAEEAARIAAEAFGVGGRDVEASVLEAARQPVDPKPAIGIEHHLGDAGIFEIAGNR